eukprot:3616769-Amphidinium_carterae.1
MQWEEKRAEPANNARAKNPSEKDPQPPSNKIVQTLRLVGWGSLWSPTTDALAPQVLKLSM